MKKMKIIVAVSALLTCGYGFGMEKTYTSIDLDGKNKELTLMIARMKKGQEIDKSKAKELIQTLNANGRIVSTQVTAYVQKYNESPLAKATESSLNLDNKNKELTLLMAKVKKGQEQE